MPCTRAPGTCCSIRPATLMVQPFDARVGVLTGQASAFGDRVWSGPGPSYLALSIGADGTMAYWNGQAGTTELLVVRQERPTARQTSELGQTLPESGAVTRRQEPSDYRADYSRRNELSNIDLSSGVPSRLTFPVGQFSFAPLRHLVARRERYLLYSSFDAEGQHLYQMAASGTGQESVPFRSPVLFPEDWSRDGRWLVYNTFGANTAVDMWAFNFADGKPRADFGRAVEPTAGASVARRPVACLRVRRVGRVGSLCAAILR